MPESKGCALSVTSGRAPAEWRLTGQEESGDRLSLSCPPPAGLPLHCSAMPAPTQGRLPSPCQAGSPVPPLRRTHRSQPPSASPPPAPHTLPWGWRGEERREEQPNLVAGTMGRPFPTCPVPASRPPGKQHRKLLAPSDNAQGRTHFHKYKARGVGPRGRQKWGGCPLLPPAPRLWSQPPYAFHLLSK